MNGKPDIGTAGLIVRDACRHRFCILLLSLHRLAAGLVLAADTPPLQG